MRVRFFIVCSLAVLGSCGSADAGLSDPDSTGGGNGTSPTAPTVAASSGTSEPPSPPDTSAPSDVTEPDSAPPALPTQDSGLTPICETIPSLDSIATTVAMPIDDMTDYSEPSIDLGEGLIINDRCEAIGPDIGMAIFTRVDVASGQAVLDYAQEQGQIVDYTSGEFPAAVAWANALYVERDGLMYSAMAITPETVGQMDAPQAYELADKLLALWLTD